MWYLSLQARQIDSIQHLGIFNEYRQLVAHISHPWPCLCSLAPGRGDDQLKLKTVADRPRLKVVGVGNAKRQSGNRWATTRPRT